MHTAEFFEKFGDLDSAVCITPWSQTDLKMSVFRDFELATSFDFFFSKNFEVKRFLGQILTYSINFVEDL